MQLPDSTSQNVFSALTAGLSFKKQAAVKAKDKHSARSERKRKREDTSDEDTDDAAAVKPAAMAQQGVTHAHLAAAALSNDPAEEANLIRKQYGIKVTGGRAPAPIGAFADLCSRYNCGPKLMANVESNGWQEPTAIQRQAIPALFEHRELFAVAPTGSGKTLAFLLPVVASLHQQRHQHSSKLPSSTATDKAQADKPDSKTAQKGLKASEPSSPAEGPRAVLKGPGAVVLAPSRELAAQTARCLVRLVKGLRLHCCLLTAAVAAGTDFTKVDLVVSTPKRLAHLVKSKQIDLSAVEFLILDEADKLFEEGFLSHIDAIIHACSHPDIVRGLFSATLPEGVESLASNVLQTPLRLTVGTRNASTSTVAQRLMFVGQEQGKLLGLRQLIAQGLKPPVLLFVSSKERAEAVYKQVMYDGVHADIIHSSQPQAQRNAAVDKFRTGATWLLIATDLVGRGMDFLGIHTVINYDFPQSTTDYIHRVGRTGRAGRSGEAITFYTENDAWQLRSIVNVMRAAGCEVPEWMLQLKKERRKSHIKAKGAAESPKSRAT